MNDTIEAGRDSTTRSQLDRLLAMAAERDPVRTAIVHPCDAVSLGGALEAFRIKLILPVVGGLIDGPLAFDNAISPEAADAKRIVSTVAGVADVLIVPNIEAGNMMAKQLAYLANAQSADIVIGARLPIILTSRADGRLSRIAS